MSSNDFGYGDVWKLMFWDGIKSKKERKKLNAIKQKELFSIKKLINKILWGRNYKD